MKNQKQEEEEEYTPDNEEYTIEEEQTSEGVGSGVSAADFDPERVLYDIKKTLQGFDKRNNQWVRISEPIARSEFINMYINSLRSLINFHNLFSQTSGDEAALNMLETLKQQIFDCVDYGIQEEHIEALVNIYDTLKNTFYGITINGRGTENVKQVLTSVYKDITALKQNGVNDHSLINWDYVNKTIKT